MRAVFLSALIVCGAIFSGCATTCPPCVPESKIVEVITPVYSCPEPPSLPPLMLPPWPTLAEDATPDQIKAWYVDMATWVKAALEAMTEDGETCRGMLDAYRAPP